MMYELKLLFVGFLPIAMLIGTYLFNAAYLGRTLFMSALDVDEGNRDSGLIIVLLSFTYPPIVAGFAYLVGLPTPFSLGDDWIVGMFMFTIIEFCLMWLGVGLVAGSDIPQAYEVRNRHFGQMAIHRIDFTKYEVGQYLIRAETQDAGTKDQTNVMRLYRVREDSDLTGVYKVLSMQHIVYDEHPFSVESIKKHLKLYFDSINYYTTNPEGLTVVKPVDKIPQVIVLE